MNKMRKSRRILPEIIGKIIPSHLHPSGPTAWVNLGRTRYPRWIPWEQHMWKLRETSWNTRDSWIFFGIFSHFWVKSWINWGVSLSCFHQESHGFPIFRTMAVSPWRGALVGWPRALLPWPSAPGDGQALFWGLRAMFTGIYQQNHMALYGTVMISIYALEIPIEWIQTSEHGDLSWCIK